MLKGPEVEVQGVPGYKGTFKHVEEEKEPDLPTLSGTRPKRDAGAKLRGLNYTERMGEVRVDTEGRQIWVIHAIIPN